ncbi:GxxExxY protein [candidate division KSB1 bacterium]
MKNKEIIRKKANIITEKVIGASIEVHKSLGPGLLESIYEECLCFELDQLKLSYDRQVNIPVVYKNLKLDGGYRVDLIVENLVIIELKTVEKILPVHEAQLLTYLKITKIPIGLLLNFNVPVLKEGLKRIVNNF